MATRRLRRRELSVFAAAGEIYRDDAVGVCLAAIVALGILSGAFAGKILRGGRNFAGRLVVLKSGVGRLSELVAAAELTDFRS